MEQIIKSTELEYFSIQKVVADLIRKNIIYQIDGKHDRYLVAEIQRDFPNAFSDSITRTARFIRMMRKQREIK